MKFHPKLLSLVLAFASVATLTAQAAENESDSIRFTSVPDIFNWNINYPQPGWTDTLDWFFTRLHDEGPDFTLNAGDIMDARWWDSPEQVVEMTEQYWTGWLNLYADYDLTVYVAPGDHEYGDDKGLEKGDIARAFGEQFTKLLGMPQNGPSSNLGRAYWVREKNLLIVTLDTFVDRGDHFGYTVGEEQLRWLDKTLADHSDADFVIVQGHLPIAGPVRSQNSSASMLEDGTDSELWKTMVKHKVDVYLTGEHHRISVTQRDGIWQVVHGALWGTQMDLNYIRGEVTKDSLSLELIEFDVKYSGGYIQGHPHRGEKNKPRENVSLSDYTKAYGTRSSGKLVLEKCSSGGDPHVQVATGWFDVE